MRPILPFPFVIVAAVARNGIIGRGGGMPWHLPGDLAHFRQVTNGHPLLMGRKTYESIGRPLPGRLTTVLSGKPGFAPPGVTVAADLEAALASVAAQARQLAATAVMVVGGAAVYASTLGLASRILITEVAAAPEGDAAFPPIDPEMWVKVESRDTIRQAEDTQAYRFTRWERRPGSPSVR